MVAATIRRFSGAIAVTMAWAHAASAVTTNTVPGGFMRAPGEPQGVFALESHLDDIARQIGMDPLDFRLKNLMVEGETTAFGERLEQVRAIETLQAAADAAAREKSRQIVNRVVLRKIGALIKSWDEEDKAARQLTRRLLAGIVIAILAFLVLDVILASHPKIQLFAISLVVGALAAAVLIARAKRRR